MNRDDVELLGGGCLSVVLVFALVAVLLWFASRSRPEFDDVTADYAIEDVLPGHRLHRVAPKGLGPVIYVVTKDGEAVSTQYREAGKHGRDVRVEVVR